MSETRRVPWTVYAALSGQVLLSAGTYLAARRAMEEVAPLNLVLWRFLLSSSVFVLLLLFTPGPKLPPPGLRLRVLLLGLVAGPINQGMFFLGLKSSSPAHASLLYALTPAGVYLYLLSRGRERFTGRRAVGLMLAFSGVAVLLLGKGLAHSVGSLWGDALILSAVSAWVVYTSEGKPLSERFGPLRATAWTMVCAGAWSWAMAPWTLSVDALTRASPAAWACLGYLGVLTSVVSYLLWYYALSRLEASRVAVFSNLQPIVTAVMAWAVVGDVLPWEWGMGAVLVLVGVRVTQSAVSPARPAGAVAAHGNG
ncbi:MAG: hypothetical protein RL653_2977 [Pseudomonadota bacterium]|jgi:drug/metabolite transporter (DMT)-like permease